MDILAHRKTGDQYKSFQILLLSYSVEIHWGLPIFCFFYFICLINFANSKLSSLCYSYFQYNKWIRLFSRYGYLFFTNLNNFPWFRTNSKSFSGYSILYLCTMTPKKITIFSGMNETHAFLVKNQLWQPLDNHHSPNFKIFSSGFKPKTLGSESATLSHRPTH